MPLTKDKKTKKYSCRYYTWGADGKRGRVFKMLGKISSKEAKVIYQRLLHESHAPKEEGKALTLSQAFESYIRNYGVNLAEGTKKGLQGYKKIYLRIFGDIPCSGLTKGRLQGYLNIRLEENVQNNPTKKITQTSVKRELAFIKTILNRAVDEELLTFNPAANFKLNQLETPSRREFFEREELERFWNAFTGKDARFKDFFRFLFYSGARISEILKLTWWSVDWKRNQVTIHLLKQRGNKRDKVFPLSPQAKEILTRLFAATERKDGFVFPDEAGKAYLIDRAEKAFRRVWEASGIKKERRITPHGLRHTFGSLLTSEGESIYQVSKALGHSSVKMTEEFYSHLAPSALQGVFDSAAKPESKNVASVSPVPLSEEPAK